MGYDGGVSEHSGVEVVVEQTDNEADDPIAISDWNGDDVTRSARTQLPSINKRREWLDGTTEQHVTRLFRRLKVGN